MAGELDDVCAQVDCPRCGTVLTVTFRQLRTLKAAGCSCGALLRLEDDTPIGAVQSLLDELNGPQAEND